MPESPLAIDLGKQFRAKRIKRGWSQGKLAYDAGVSPDTVMRFENLGRISLDGLQSLAESLKVQLKVVNK